VVYRPFDGTGGPAQPAPDIWIEASWAETRTDSSGRYFLYGLPTDSAVTLIAMDGSDELPWVGVTVDPGGDVVRDIQLLACKPDGSC
jgi:hypothetical protein